MEHVRWEQPGKLEVMEISADKTDSGWKFWTKGKWDVRWGSLSSTAELVATAERKLRTGANTIVPNVRQNYSVVCYSVVRTEAV